ACFASGGPRISPIRITVPAAQIQVPTCRDKPTKGALICSATRRAMLAATRTMTRSLSMLNLRYDAAPMCTRTESEGKSKTTLLPLRVNVTWADKGSSNGHYRKQNNAVFRSWCPGEGQRSFVIRQWFEFRCE